MKFLAILIKMCGQFDIISTSTLLVFNYLCGRFDLINRVGGLTFTHHNNYIIIYHL